MKISCEIIGKVDSGDVSKISMENNNGVVISTLTTGANTSGVFWFQRKPVLLKI